MINMKQKEISDYTGTVVYEAAPMQHQDKNLSSAVKSVMSSIQIGFPSDSDLYFTMPMVLEIS